MTTPTSRRTLGAVLALPLTLALGGGPAVAQPTGSEVERPSGDPDRRFEITAAPETDPGGGQQGASGRFDLDLYVDDDVICHDITITGLEGDDFSSPAPTSTHIHEGFPGTNGGPIWLFPDPEMTAAGEFVTQGCLEASFVEDSGITSVAQILASPANRYVDVHRGGDFASAPNVRGNFQGAQVAAAGGGADTAPADGDAQAGAMPAEGTGPDAGLGGLAAADGSRTLALTGAALLLALTGAATASQLAGRRVAVGRTEA